MSVNGADLRRVFETTGQSLGSSVLADLIDLLAECIDKYNAGGEGYDRLAGALNECCNLLRRAGYTAMDAELMLMTRHSLKLPPMT